MGEGVLALPPPITHTSYVSVPFFAVTMAGLIDRLSERGWVLLGLVIAAFVIDRAMQRGMPPAIKSWVMRQSTPATEIDLAKRADTLSHVLLGGARIALAVVAVLMIADELQINIFPVVAGLGIGGIAIGLGAQSLVKDAINGIFILTENQYGKGDMVTIAGVQGWVEEVNLRRTVLRDIDGTLHSVPNGEVKVASNMTRGYSGVNLVVPIAPGADVEKALELLNKVGQELAEDESFRGEIIEPPQVVRIDTTSAERVDVRVIGRVVPGAQWRVAAALRRRVMTAFDKDGIKFGPIAPAPPTPPTPSSPAPPPRP
jgi:small-conductance mechanosensitive channel